MTTGSSTRTVTGVPGRQRRGISSAGSHCAAACACADDAADRRALPAAEEFHR